MLHSVGIMTVSDMADADQRTILKLRGWDYPQVRAHTTFGYHLKMFPVQAAGCHYCRFQSVFRVSFSHADPDMLTLCRCPSRSG
jgi:hypothetical protein